MATTDTPSLYPSLSPSYGSGTPTLSVGPTYTLSESPSYDESVYFTWNVTGSVLEYSAHYITEHLHALPRVGTSNEFALLFSTDDSIKTNYIVGISGLALALGTLAVVWFVFVLLFKLAGGPCAGDRLRGGTLPRICFCNAGLIWIAATVLFVFNGFQDMNNTFLVIGDNVTELITLVTNLDAIASSLDAVGNETRDPRDQLVEELTDFCPTNASLKEKTGYDFYTQAEDAITILDTLGNLIDDEIEDMQNGFDLFLPVLEDVEGYLEKADMTGYTDMQVYIFAIVWGAIPAILMMGLILAWFNISAGPLEVIFTFGFIPAVFILTLLAVGIACFSSVALIANADFCAGGDGNTPDGSIYEILEINNITANDTFYEAVGYYISQCTIDNPFEFAVEYHNNLVDANRDVDGMKAAIKSVGISALEELCAPKNFTSTSSLLDIMDTNMDTLQTDAYQGLEQLRCDNVVPLYVNTAYNGACTYGINGLFWTTLTFAIMSISGFIMVLFRAAVINNASGSFIPKSQPGPHRRPRPPAPPKKAVAIL